MGDISIIARRLSDGSVQYGWSGNGGFYKRVGSWLLTEYRTPGMVDYLFGLGQLRLLREPHSENRSGLIRTVPTGQPHWSGKSENEIFSRIAFIDYGYFYDRDGRWYYIIPGPFRIKMPLELVAENLDENYFEHDFRRKIQRMVVDAVIERGRTDEDFRRYLAENGYDDTKIAAMADELADSRHPCHDLWRNHKKVFLYFNDWVVVKTDEDCREVTGILLMPEGEKHIETIDR